MAFDAAMFEEKLAPLSELLASVQRRRGRMGEPGERNRTREGRLFCPGKAHKSVALIGTRKARLEGVGAFVEPDRFAQGRGTARTLPCHGAIDLNFQIPVEFRLPADKLTTSLADTPPTYWQIEAKGEAIGANYQAYFLVPVYKKP